MDELRGMHTSAESCLCPFHVLHRPNIPRIFGHAFALNGPCEDDARLALNAAGALAGGHNGFEIMAVDLGDIPAERRQVNRQQDRTSRAIYRKKHNARVQ